MRILEASLKSVGFILSFPFFAALFGLQENLGEFAVQVASDYLSLLSLLSVLSLQGPVFGQTQRLSASASPRVAPHHRHFTGPRCSRMVSRMVSLKVSLVDHWPIAQNSPRIPMLRTQAGPDVGGVALSHAFGKSAGKANRAQKPWKPGKANKNQQNFSSWNFGTTFSCPTVAQSFSPRLLHRSLAVQVVAKMGGLDGRCLGGWIRLQSFQRFKMNQRMSNGCPTDARCFDVP